MISGVYKLTNIVTKKYYIGSSVNIHKRIIDHFSKLKRKIHHSKKFQNSYNKYGKSNFVHEVLEYCEIEKLQEKEQYYLDLMFNKNCLNILKEAYTASGENHPRFGIKHTQESRDKIKLARSKQIISHSPETRIKMGLSGKGKIVPMDHINKMVAARNGKAWNKGINCPNPSKVVLNKEKTKELQEFYNETKNISATAREFNLDWQITKRHLTL